MEARGVKRLPALLRDQPSQESQRWGYQREMEEGGLAAGKDCFWTMTCISCPLIVFTSHVAFLSQDLIFMRYIKEQTKEYGTPSESKHRFKKGGKHRFGSTSKPFPLPRRENLARTEDSAMVAELATSSSRIN
jgi:hypothetical protein